MKTKNSFHKILLAVGVALAVLLLPTNSKAVDTAKANTTTMNLTTDWAGGVVPTVANALRPSWNATTITASNNLLVTLGGDIACNGMDLRPFPNTAACPSLKIGSGNTLGLTGTVIQNNNGGWDSTFNCGIQLVGNTILRVQGDMIINGAITQDATPRSLTLNNDSGALHLTAANSYGGGTLIAYGILTLGGSGTLGATTGNLTWQGAGILDLGGTTQTVKDVDLSKAFIQNGTLSSTSLYKNGPGLVTANLQGATATMTMNDGTGMILSGTNTYGGVTSIGGPLRATRPIALPNSGASGTFTITSGSAFLAVRAGAASGEWASGDIDSLLANAAFTVTSSGGALGIDTTGGNFTYASVIPSKASNLGFRKLGPNTLTLSGANLYTKTTTITRGTLKLDAGAGGSLNSGSALTFTGTGTFNDDDTTVGGNTTQTLGALTTSAGEATVQLTRVSAFNTFLTFASLASRTAGATRNYAVTGTPGVNGTDSKISFTAGPTASVFLDQGSFFGGSGYAAYDAGGFLRAMNYSTDNASAGGSVGSSFATFTAAGANGKHVDLGSAGTITAAGTESINSLRIGGVNTLTLAGTLTIANGGILKTGGNASIISSGGNLSSGGTELVIRTDAAADKLTINSPILLNTVTKSGAGTLELNAANTFTTLRLNAGTLSFKSANSVPSTCTLLINEGTTLDNTSGANLTISGGSLTTQIAGSVTYLGTSGDLNLGTDGAFNSMPNDVTFTINANTLKIVKELVSYSTGAVTKNGPGTLGFAGNGQNQFVGGMTINNGVLAGGPNGNHNQTAGFGPVTLGDTTGVNPATLYLANDAGNGSPLTARAGSSGILALVSETGKFPRWEGPVTLNNALTLASINGSSGILNMYGVISGGSTLNIGNTNSIVVSSATKTLVNQGIVKLWRINSYTGNTVLNSGTLSLGALASIDTTPLVSIAAGATLDVSAIAAYTLSASTTLGAKGTGTTAGTTQATLKGGTSVSLGAQPIALTFTPTSGSGDTTHPALVVSQGTLTLVSNTISVVNNGPTLGAGVYRLIQVTNGVAGTITGVPNTNAVTVTGTGGLAANSTALATVSSGNVILTVTTKSVTSFSSLTGSQTVQASVPNVALSGTISASGPLYPANGETIHVRINGVTQNTTVNSVGQFTIAYATIPPAGGPYPITYTYDGNATLTTATNSATELTVSAQTVPTITAWPTASAITYGQDLTSSTLTGGSASTAGTFTFTAPSTIPSTAGTYAASGTFTPTDTVNFATVVASGVINVSVGAKGLTITSGAVTSKTYTGTAAATITGTLSGVVAGDGVAQINFAGTGTFASSGVANGIAVTSTATLTGTKASSYTLTQPTGLTGNITPATLTVTADNKARAVGAANPTFTSTTTGFVNSENAGSASVTGTPSLSTTADGTSVEGSYAITCTANTLAAPNYTFTPVNGILYVVGSLTWRAGNGTWDIATSLNWTNSGGATVPYVDAVPTRFDDTATGNPYTVTLNTTVQPGNMTFSGTKNYTIAGSTGIIGGTASLTKSGSGALTLGGVNSFSGGILVSGGSFLVESGNARIGTGSLTLAGGTFFRVANDPEATVTNAIVLSGGDVGVDVSFGGGKDLVITGPVSGAGRFNVSGDLSGRRFEMLNDNTFTGGVLLSGGNVNPRLRIGTIRSLGTGTLRSELSGVNGGLENGSDLSGNGGITNTIDIAVNLNVGNNGSGNMRLAGTITNVGSLTKLGSSTLTLSGANTYSGATTISGGKVVVNGANSGAGAVTVASTAYLGGIGSIGGNVSYASGAFGLFTNGGTLAIAGTLTLNANVVHLNLQANLGGGNYTLATYNPTGSSGSFASTPVVDSGSLLSGATATVTTAGGTVTLTVSQTASVVTVTSSSPTNGYLDNVTFTATVGGAVTPTGTVLFKTNTVAFGGAVGLTAGVASTNLATLPRGTNVITAEYSGDVNYLASSGSRNQVVTNHPPMATNFTFGAVLGGSVSYQVIGGKTAPTDVDGDSMTVTAVGTASSGSSGSTSSNVTYVASGSAGTNTFTYTVTDTFGGTDTKTVTVVVSDNPGFNLLSGPVNNGNGTFTFGYLGIPGLNYALDESPDLVSPYTWSPVITNAASGAGAISYTVPLTYPSGSFRARHVP